MATVTLDTASVRSDRPIRRAFGLCALGFVIAAAAVFGANLASFGFGELLWYLTGAYE